MSGIYKKVFDVQSSVERIKKDSKNPHFKNTYVDINGVLEAILPRLNESKVLLLQPTFTTNGVNYLQTKLVDYEDGSEIVSDMILPPNLDAQKTGSALTYYRRYMLVSMLGLQAVDDDGKAGSSPIKETKAPTEEMILEMESLMNGNEDFKNQWLNFLQVKSFDKASLGQIEKAIKQIKGR